jgi:hypothetical protein
VYPDIPDYYAFFTYSLFRGKCRYKKPDKGICALPFYLVFTLIFLWERK